MFERGFKTWCENYSTSKRVELGLAKDAPLDSLALAAHLGVRVWSPENVPGLSRETLEILLRNDGTPSCWSAVSLVVGAKVLVILNTAHSAARQSSDLTHELAHRILKHDAKEVALHEGLLLLSDYEKQQEEEADWLSSCLLLPREALLAIKRLGLSEEEAATNYRVSKRMLTYRMARTGVNRQFAGAA